MTDMPWGKKVGFRDHKSAPEALCRALVVKEKELEIPSTSPPPQPPQKDNNDTSPSQKFSNRTLAIFLSVGAVIAGSGLIFLFFWKRRANQK